MFGKSTICCSAALTVLLLTILSQRLNVCAELLNNVDNVDAINNLYENLLQREYAGPIVFPSHQMERKAQRSPSLRLRFGRRSDPDSEPANAHMFAEPSAEKRWWGDVNQKPIRSPSLRLRFGKRQSADLLSARNNFDALLNNLAAVEENLADYNDGGYENGYERVVRKPQRLRWGRSVPYQAAENNFADLDNEPQRDGDSLSPLANADKWRNLLLTLGPYEGAGAAGVAGIATNDDQLNEFEREVRKPGGPLRLRWGRSTGGRGSSISSSNNNNMSKSTDDTLSGKQFQEKKSLGANVLSESKVEQPPQTQPNVN